MLRISLCYISLVIFFSVFFSLMTLKNPNYQNQFNINNEDMRIILMKSATH